MLATCWRIRLRAKISLMKYAKLTTFKAGYPNVSSVTVYLKKMRIIRAPFMIK